VYLHSVKKKSYETDENKKQSFFEIIINQMNNSINFGLSNPQFAKFVVKLANETNIEIKKKIQNEFLISGRIKIDIKNEDKIMNYIKYYMDFMKNGLS